MLTSGFFNSLNGDRVYDTDQISQIFDGLIVDGVYETIGDMFSVTPGSGMQVFVGSGRAWFNHTWTYNTSRYPLELVAASSLNRIDLIVLEVNPNDNVRDNSIKVVQGTPASNPVEPTLRPVSGAYQHPLAAVYVPANATGISASNITNYVGTERCPFVFGVLKTMDIEWFIAQIQSQWGDLRDSELQEFRDWWATVRYVMDDDVAGHLQNEIDAIRPMTDAEIDTIWNSVIGGDM